jgi:hypothetical protein
MLGLSVRAGFIDQLRGKLEFYVDCLFVLFPGIRRAGSSLAFGERHAVWHLSLFRLYVGILGWVASRTASKS